MAQVNHRFHVSYVVNKNAFGHYHHEHKDGYFVISTGNARREESIEALRSTIAKQEALKEGETVALINITWLHAE